MKNASKPFIHRTKYEGNNNQFETEQKIVFPYLSLSPPTNLFVKCRIIRTVTPFFKAIIYSSIAFDWYEKHFKQCYSLCIIFLRIFIPIAIFCVLLWKLCVFKVKEGVLCSNYLALYSKRGKVPLVRFSINIERSVFTITFPNTRVHKSKFPFLRMG
jgi:hypothetical protein